MLYQEIDEIIDDLSEFSGFTPSLIRGWYEKLKEYSCFRDELAGDCLEVLCQRRCEVNNDTESSKTESLVDSIEFALCETFENEALNDNMISIKTKMDFGYEEKEIDYDIQDDYMEIMDKDEQKRK